MSDLIKNLSQDIQKFQEDSEELKNRFGSIIQDKSIPLEGRWDLFCKSPDFLKKHDSYIVHFKSLEKDVPRHFNYNEVFGYEKHETIKTFDLVDRIEGCLPVPGEEEHKFAKRLLDKIPNMRTPNGLNDFKEEILSMNMDTFEFDW